MKYSNKDIYKIIKSNYRNKENNEKDLDKYISRIKSICKNEPNNLNYKKLLARLYMDNEDYYGAQKVYLDILKQDETNAAAYFGLFKVDLAIDDDAQLLYDLGDFEYFFRFQKDLDLLYDLTNLYLDIKEGMEKDYEFDYKGIIVNNSVTDKTLDEYLKNTFDNLKVKNYKQAFHFINLARNYKIQKDISISIDPIYTLIKKIYNLTKEKDFDYSEKKQEALKTKDYITFAILCKNQSEESKYNTIDLFNDIGTLLHFRRIEESKLLLNKLRNRVATKDEKIAYAFLANSYDELANLSYEELEFLEYGKHYFNKKMYFDALNYLKKGYEINNNNLFNYYIAKCFRNIDDLYYEDYIDNLVLYSQKAGLKAYKAYAKLSSYYIKGHNKKEALKYFNKYKALKKMFRIYNSKKIKKYDYEWLENLMYNGKSVVKSEKQISKTLKLKDFKSE